MWLWSQCREGGTECHAHMLLRTVLLHRKPLKEMDVDALNLIVTQMDLACAAPIARVLPPKIVTRALAQRPTKPTVLQRLAQ